MHVQLIRFFCLFFISTSSLYADHFVQSNVKVLPILIDTDADLEGMMAIVYLIRNPRVDVKGITTVGSGVSHWEYGGKNILKILELIGDSKTFVSLGAKESLSPVGAYPQNWRKQADEVSGIQLPYSPHHFAEEKGPDFIVDVVLKSEEKITLLAIGPLTNIALAFQKNPEIKDKVERIFIMGGALLTPGNLTERCLGFKNRFAEYNISLDVKAAADIFNSGVPITLIPLDIIDYVPSQPFYKMISENRETSSANLIYEILKPSVKNKKRSREFLWDPATAVLITNPNIASYRNLKVMINLRKGPEYGRLIISSKGTPIQVVTQIDTQLFYKIFLETLN